MLPFTKPAIAGDELANIEKVLHSGHWTAGTFSEQCNEIIKAHHNVKHAMITPSCTAALEMCALVAEIGRGDEVIMPSYTYASTANAVLLTGAKPVFVDIRPDTLNIDENLIEMAITSATRAIMVVHYAGVCCNMDAINHIAQKHGLIVIEDAAQAYLSFYRGRMAGELGHMAAFSFHATKNISCGEGGAFVTNDDHMANFASIIRIKGTNRDAFRRGEVQQYEWITAGGSYEPSEFTAAVLLAQLQNAQTITAERINIWRHYYARLEHLGVSLPLIPIECAHNAHIFYLLVDDRDRLIDRLQAVGIQASAHYYPLHSSQAGNYYQLGRHLPVTDSVAERVLRLPLWTGMTVEQVEEVCGEVERWI